MSIITYPLNGVTYNASDAETYLSTRASGVYSADGHFGVTITGAHTLSISPGLAWINNATFKGKSIAVTTAESVTIPIADGSLSRLDLVVLRFDAAANRSYFAVISGSPASSPVAPLPSRTEAVYELGLYLIHVPASSVEITESNIESKLLDETYCGVMRDSVTGIPTAQIQAQAEALISELRAQIGNVVGATSEITSDGGEPAVDVSLTDDGSGNKNISFVFRNVVGKDGKDGKDGVTPHIGSNGHWYVGDTDTGVVALQYTYGTEDLTPGVSPLPTGTLHFVYE